MLDKRMGGLMEELLRRSMERGMLDDRQMVIDWMYFILK